MKEMSRTKQHDREVMVRDSPSALGGFVNDKMLRISHTWTKRIAEPSWKIVLISMSQRPNIEVARLNRTESYERTDEYAERKIR